jgi:hypothetical protein
MATQTQTGVVTRGHRLNSVVAFVAGGTFVLLGLAGFLVAGGHRAVGESGGVLFGLFQVNMLHNVVHIAAGAALVAAGIVGAREAKFANCVLGVGCLALVAVGLAVIGTRANVLALNPADNALHLGLGLTLALAGFRADRHLD